MKQSAKRDYYHKNLFVLQRIISEIVPEHEERMMNGTVMYFYHSRALVAFKKSGGSLVVLTPGRTPQERRKAMRSYMTLLGNIKVRPGQPFPTGHIRTILLDRKTIIDSQPARRSFYSLLSNKSKNGVSLARHEKTAARIKTAESNFPKLQKVSKHPKIEPWVLPVAATVEVGAGLFALLVLLPWVLSLLPDVTIPLPTIDLPAIPLPNWNLPFAPPDLPSWLSTLLYWFNKTLPIWIALLIAIKVVLKKRQSKAPRV